MDLTDIIQIKGTPAPVKTESCDRCCTRKVFLTEGITVSRCTNRGNWNCSGYYFCYDCVRKLKKSHSITILINGQTKYLRYY